MRDESIARVSLIAWLRSGKHNTVQSVLQNVAVGDPRVFAWCVAAVLDALLPLIVDDQKSGPARAIQFTYDVVTNGMPPEGDREPYLEVTMKRAANATRAPAGIKATWEQQMFYEYLGKSAADLVSFVFSFSVSPEFFQYEKSVGLLSAAVERAVKESGIAAVSGNKSKQAEAEWAAGVASFAIQNYPHFLHPSLRPKQEKELFVEKVAKMIGLPKEELGAYKEAKAKAEAEERESYDIAAFRNLIETSSGPLVKQRSTPIRYKKRKKKDRYSR